jgi:hypothetical protein
LIASSWGLFLVDRCAATALHFSAGFVLDRITTPLPRSWAEYESVSAWSAMRARSHLIDTRKTYTMTSAKIGSPDFSLPNHIKDAV